MEQLLGEHQLANFKPLGSSPPGANHENWNPDAHGILLLGRPLSDKQHLEGQSWGRWHVLTCTAPLLGRAPAGRMGGARRCSSGTESIICCRITVCSASHSPYGRIFVYFSFICTAHPDALSEALSEACPVLVCSDADEHAMTRAASYSACCRCSVHSFVFS